MNMPQLPAPLPTDGKPLNLSRRRFLGASLGALVLGVLLPGKIVRAAQRAASEIKPGPHIPAFLEIRPDGTAMLRSPFVEGGQGIYTAFAQIVGEELDIAPERFSVECAPPGADYLLVNGARFTGGSFSVRSSYEVMRRLGACARHMLLQAAAARLNVPPDSLTTQPGIVVHEASGRTLGYGELAALAAGLPPPEQVPLRERKDFRWIGKSIPRLDARDKSTGKVTYNIDLEVDGMLLAAVQHAPRMGGEPGAIANEAEVKAMPGVHSIHRLPGAVAVVAQRWWQARRAVGWHASVPESTRAACRKRCTPRPSARVPPSAGSAASRTRPTTRRSKASPRSLTPFPIDGSPRVYLEHPPTIGFWRSVGHSMNDFFYESFFDEVADAGQQDPYELRLRLLADKPRHKALLQALAELSGGWKRGPFTAGDGSQRARGVAMASPFGSEVATIAEVSLEGGSVQVHDVWVAFDPGSIVNPAIVEAQVKSAVALGLSSTLLEEVVYENGMPRARNFGAYATLPPGRMPRVHVRIVESGAPMGGVGEPGLPGVPPAVINAVAALTGQRVRSLPLSRTRFAGA